jgi:hypothetical protein
MSSGHQCNRHHHKKRHDHRRRQDDDSEWFVHKKDLITPAIASVAPPPDPPMDPFEATSFIVQTIDDQMFQALEAVQFQIGISSTDNKRHLIVDPEGKFFTVETPGTYRIIFEGGVISEEPNIELLFDVTELDSRYLDFVVVPLDLKHENVNVSTLIPLRTKMTLAVRFREAKSVLVKARSKLQIYRVSE